MAVLNDTIRGEVLSVQNNQIVLLDQDGFERSYSLNEIVLSIDNEEYNIDFEKEEEQLRLKLRDVVNEAGPTVNNRSVRTVIDLHIEELVDDHRHMTNFEIVMTQMESCKRFIRNALNNDLRKVTIIHGKGSGVLKSEVYTFLDKLKREHDIKLNYHDAPYTEFGMGGATEVLFG